MLRQIEYFLDHPKLWFSCYKRAYNEVRKQSCANSNTNSVSRWLILIWIVRCYIASSDFVTGLWGFFQIFFNNLFLIWGWWDGLEVRNTFCFCRGFWFGSQYTHGGLTIIRSQEFDTLFWLLGVGHSTQVVHRHAPIHIKYFLNSLLIFKYGGVCICECKCLQRISDHLSVLVTGVVSRLIWVLTTKLGSSSRAVHSLNHLNTLHEPSL